MGSTRPIVSVVILNWRGTDDTVKCIEALDKSDYKNIELIIVDNESTPESREILEKLPFFGTKKLICNDKNLGFTGGEISGFQQCEGDYILLLNNDAAIDEHAITQAVATMESQERIAVVGGRSYTLDEDWMRQGAHFYSHQRIDPVSADVMTYGHDDGIAAEVSNISGACVLIRREAIEECGYFDNRFFAYYEETDLFSRFRRHGWKIFYDPTVIVWHKHGASTRNKRYMYYYYMLKNQYLFAAKNFDKPSLKLFKRSFRRHVRRSLKIYLKNIGRLDKNDYVHKARVMSYLNNILTLPVTLAARHKNLSVNKEFSLNDQLFKDAPIPMSILIDATRITVKQHKQLVENLKLIAKLEIRPAEVIVVSRKPLAMPKTDSMMRIANIVDADIFDMTPLDFFMMTSNYDMLLLGTKDFLEGSFEELKDGGMGNSLRNLYSIMASEELAGIVISPSSGSSHKLGRGEFLRADFSITAIKKEFIVHYLVDNTDIKSLDMSVLTNVLGESIAQCRSIQVLPGSMPLFGLPATPPTPEKYPIVTSPLRWNTKKLLISLHILIFIKLGLALLKKLTGRSESDSADEEENDEVDKDALTYSKDIPIVINTRDRFDPLMLLIKWLESVGHNRIMFVDNDSTYPPLLDYFAKCPYQVVNLGRNGMHKAPWESFGVRFAAKQLPYIVSDPDIVPSPECRKDAVKHFVDLLNRHPRFNKAGFGLLIDDLPDNFALKEHVITWESRFWDEKKLLEEGAYDADLDTTFAVYRPHTWWFLGPSIRTGKPYVARHEPWYQDSTNPTEDFLYYTARANNNVSTWAFGKLPKHHLRALKKEGFLPDFIDDEEENYAKKDR